MPRALIALIVAASALAAVAAPQPGPDAASLETATFSMYCYWTGEATLGRVDGVEASRIGHWGGQEIVQVDYDPRKTDPAALARALIAQRSFYAVLADGSKSHGELASSFDDGQIRRVSGAPHFIEPKHSLRTRYPQLAGLELSEAQRIALNSWAYFGGPIPDVLTAEQRRLVDKR
ncbi:MAG: hypothetical protein AAGF23_18040 [Acidobacteriota bacterium]